MTRRKKPLPELPRVYVRPQLDRRQREACRAFFVATCSGDKKRPASGTVDPLWLRWGMRASLIQQRAGWVISSPTYSDSLDRHPEHDPSLPGPVWLQHVYRYDRDLCVMPRTLAVIEARMEERRRREMPPQPAEQPRLEPVTAQADLFEEVSHG